MSRSYRNYCFSVTAKYRCTPWALVRSQERMCIREKLRAGNYGDLVFPSCGVQKAWFSRIHGYYLSRAAIRNSIFKEIRDILNGYTDGRNYRRKNDYESAFLTDFYRIKNGEKPYERYSGLHFCWLKNKEVKKVIKNWQGDPLDVLYYLNYRGLIEKAVIREQRKRKETV